MVKVIFISQYSIVNAWCHNLVWQGTIHMQHKEVGGSKGGLLQLMVETAVEVLGIAVDTEAGVGVLLARGCRKAQWHFQRPQIQILEQLVVAQEQETHEQAG